MQSRYFVQLNQQSQIICLNQRKVEEKFSLIRELRILDDLLIFLFRARKENSRFLMLARDTAQKDKIELNV